MFQESEIWPQSSQNVMIFFQPSEIGEITSTAYLEIGGREERLSLWYFKILKNLNTLISFIETSFITILV